MEQMERTAVKRNARSETINAVKRNARSETINGIKLKSFFGFIIYLSAHVNKNKNNQYVTIYHQEE